jgi:hypothetical protein
MFLIFVSDGNTIGSDVSDVFFTIQNPIGKGGSAVGTNGNGKNGYFVKGLIFGCVSGALAGLLFAPKSGKKLRADIKDKGSDALKDTKEFCLDTQKKAKSVFDDTVDMLSDACVKTKGVFFRS